MSERNLRINWQNFNPAFDATVWHDWMSLRIPAAQILLRSRQHRHRRRSRNWQSDQSSQCHQLFRRACGEPPRGVLEADMFK
jgi:hypothetical protein